jgi:hydroxymethylbilane synthase
VNSRVAKLDDGHYDAIILACAGLERLGMAGRIRSRLSSPEWLPAPGQAAIAIEIREDDMHVHNLTSALDDEETRIAVTAERAMNEQLGGNCSVPVAAWCVVAERGLTLHGLVGDVQSGRILRATADSATDDPVALGQEVARMLREAGADELLAPHAGHQA